MIIMHNIARCSYYRTRVLVFVSSWFGFVTFHCKRIINRSSHWIFDSAVVVFTLRVIMSVCGSLGEFAHQNFDWVLTGPVVLFVRTITVERHHIPPSM